MRKKIIRDELTSKLLEVHCLWSYNNVTTNDVPDDVLIEKSLVYLDLDDISRLFLLFPSRKIKSVWLSSLVPQDEYYHAMNRFFAWYYFKVKNPDSYLKSMITRHYHKL